MASAWSTAWGSSWGVSWGDTGAAPVVIRERGDGASSRYSPDRVKRRERSARRVAAYAERKELVYLENRATAVDTVPPDMERRKITAAAIAEAVDDLPFWASLTKAEATKVLPSAIYVTPGAKFSAHDMTVALTAYLRRMAEDAAAVEDENDIEMLLLTAA